MSAERKKIEREIAINDSLFAKCYELTEEYLESIGNEVRCLNPEDYNDDIALKLTLITDYFFKKEWDAQERLAMYEVEKGKVEAIIKKQKDGKFRVFCSSQPFWGEGQTLKGAKEQMLLHMEQYKKSAKEKGSNYPAILDEPFEIEYQHDK